MQRLGLEVVGYKQKTCCPSSNFELPDDLPSIEMALLKLAAAMKALEDSKLTKTMLGG